MNYLVHLYLSDPDPLCRLGNMMGDFVKGRLPRDGYPDRLLFGLRQHRAVDRIAHDHPAVRRSKARLDDGFGHTKSILIDIFYDHCLARHWDRLGRGELSDFTQAAYALLRDHDRYLTDDFRVVARRMVENDWLNRYRDPKIIRLTLKKIGDRLKRPNRLAEGYIELDRCGDDLALDCGDFLTSARELLSEDRRVRGVPTARSGSK